jgi:hypothetical protein
VKTSAADASEVGKTAAARQAARNINTKILSAIDFFILGSGLSGLGVRN